MTTDSTTVIGHALAHLWPSVGRRRTDGAEIRQVSSQTLRRDVVLEGH